MLFELFFSGSWQAIEFGLAIIGALTLGKIIYNALLEWRREGKDNPLHLDQDELDRIKNNDKSLS